MLGTVNGPRYVQIARELFSRVESGVYPVGKDMPTEVKLCEEFGTSRFTVREALRDLEKHRVIVRRQGSGSRVIAARPSTIYSFSATNPLDVTRYASETEVEYHLRFQGISQNAINLLDIEDPNEWLWMSGVRRNLSTGLYIGISSAFVRKEYASSIADVERVRTGAIFERICQEHGLVMTHIEQTIEATTVTHSMARRLSCEPGAPALQILRKYCSIDGPFEMSASVHPANQFKYQLRLERDRARN